MPRSRSLQVCVLSILFQGIGDDVSKNCFRQHSSHGNSNYRVS